MSNRGDEDGIYNPNAAAAGSLDFAVTATDKIRHYTALVSEKLSNKVENKVFCVNQLQNPCPYANFLT
jgi:hypothetical protein